MEKISLRKIEIVLPESGGRKGRMNDRQVKIKDALCIAINVLISLTLPIKTVHYPVLGIELGVL